MKTSADVVIAGGGPVGLMLALELHQRGVDVMLLEQKTEPSYFVKALGISPRTLEIWDQRGLLEEALSAGIFLRGTAVIVDGVESEAQHAPTEGYGYGVLALPQYDAERILRDALLRHGGRIEWGTALTALEDRGDRVVATLRGADGPERRVECGYVAGCDGAHSTVRHALGFGYEGQALEMTFMLGDVLIDAPLTRGMAYRAIHLVDGEMRNMVVAIPIAGDPRRYRLSMAAPEAYWQEGADLATPPTLEILSAAVESTFPAGTTLSDLRWSSFYRISHRIASQYSSGRCFLAGDAAHIHPPIGGQGMNTGLQDAFNLGWKLALAVDGRAADGFLESYGAERRPVGLEVVNRTSARMGKVIEGSDRGETDAQMRDDSQLFVHYADSAWVTEDPSVATRSPRGPRAGERAPEVAGLKREYVDAPARLLHLLRHTGHTAFFYADETTTEAEYRRFAALADELRRRLGDVACHGIGAPSAKPLDLERVRWARDTAGRFRAGFGAVGGSIELVRPDGYVGYRGAVANTDGLRAALDRVVRAPSS